MKTIYQAELASKIPVIVYVSPEGARAASAGVWISQAADVLAMAPVSNIGSSTPIDSSGQNLGSDLRRKVINDAARSLQSLAANHHRNTRWPVAAVTKASNLTSQQALHMHVIDTIAPSLPALLRQLDGYKTKPKGFVLHLADADIKQVHPGFFTRLLNTLIDPNIISLLFLAGLAGIGYEIFHPGVALLVIDLHVVSHGALTVAGLICLAVGSIMLFHNAPPPYHTSKPLVIGVAVTLGAIWAFAVGKAWQVRRSPVLVSPQAIAGAVGE